MMVVLMLLIVCCGKKASYDWKKAIVILRILRGLSATLFPYTTLFRSDGGRSPWRSRACGRRGAPIPRGAVILSSTPTCRGPPSGVGMRAHRSRGVAARAARQASSRSLPHDDRAGHQLAVDGAVVLVRAGSIKPDRIRPAPGHGAAAREARRADGLDAVRQRSGPGPGDGAADRDGIDRRIRGPVVTAHELDTGAGGDRARRPTAPAATPPPRPTPTPALHTSAPITPPTPPPPQPHQPHYPRALPH